MSGEVSADRARAALDDFLALPIFRYPHILLLKRAFELRNNATVYGAMYLVLAEGLDTTLLTRDSALAIVPGIAAKVEVIPGTNS